MSRLLDTQDQVTRSIDPMNVLEVLKTRLGEQSAELLPTPVPDQQLNLYVAAIAVVAYAGDDSAKQKPEIDNCIVPDTIITEETLKQLRSIPTERRNMEQMLIEAIIFAETHGQAEVYPATVGFNTAVQAINLFKHAVSVLASVNGAPSHQNGFLNYIMEAKGNSTKHIADHVTVAQMTPQPFHVESYHPYQDIEDGIINAGFTPRDDVSVNAYGAAVCLTLGMVDEASKYGIELPDMAFILSRKIDALAEPDDIVRDAAYKMLIAVAVGMITRQKDYVFARTLAPNTAARILEVFLSYLYKIIALNDLIIATGPLAKQHAEPATRHRFIHEVLNSASMTANHQSETSTAPVKRPEQTTVPEVIYELLAVAERQPEDRNFLLGAVARYIHEYLDDGVDGMFADFSARDLPR